MSEWEFVRMWLGRTGREVWWVDGGGSMVRCDVGDVDAGGEVDGGDGV